MSTTTTAPRSSLTSLARLTPRGPVWAVLRIHRPALRVWALLCALTAGALLWAYLLGADAVRDWNRSATASCATVAPCGDALGGPTYEFYESVQALANSAIVYLPYLVAAWAGAALIGRELENGTAELAWTQSVSPGRWLAAKLAVPAVLIAAGTTVLVVLHRLMWTEGRDILGQDWYETDVLRANGPVAVAYALCALAVGALAGLALRRALPALGAAFLVTLAVQNLGDLYRTSLWPTVHVTGAAASNPPGGAQIIDHGVVLDTGRRIGNNWACVDSDSATDINRCMDKNGIAEVWATYHPSSHFWPLQLVESGLVLGAAALAVIAAFVLLSRRTATSGAAV